MITWPWIVVGLLGLLLLGLAIAAALSESRCETCGGLRFHAGWCPWGDL